MVSTVILFKDERQTNQTDQNKCELDKLCDLMTWHARRRVLRSFSVVGRLGDLVK